MSSAINPRPHRAANTRPHPRRTANTRPRLALDTNVVLDFLNERHPHFEAARTIMIAGRIGAFELWLSSSQITDLIYVMSDGGKTSKMGDVLARLRGLRTFINVFAISDAEIDKMLAANWADPEDYLIFEMALQKHADAIITRDAAGFESDLVPVYDCAEFLAHLRDTSDIDLAFTEI